MCNISTQDVDLVIILWREILWNIYNLTNILPQEFYNLILFEGWNVMKYLQFEYDNDHLIWNSEDTAKFWFPVFQI